MVKSKENLLGAYAFFVGIVLALILGILNALNSPASSESIFYTLIIIVGCVVGLLSIGDKNSATLLFASLSIVLVGNFGRESLRYLAQTNISVNILRETMNSLQFLFIPVTIIVALKTVFAMAKI